MATRNLNYDRFRNDPEWIKVKRVSKIDGPIVWKQESFYAKRGIFQKLLNLLDEWSESHENTSHRYPPEYRIVRME